MSFGSRAESLRPLRGGKGAGRDAAPQGAQSHPLGVHLVGVSQGKGLPQPVLQRGKPELRVRAFVLCKSVEPDVVEGEGAGAGGGGQRGAGWWGEALRERRRCCCRIPVTHKSSFSLSF